MKVPPITHHNNVVLSSTLLKHTLDNKAKYLIINIMAFQLDLVYHFSEMDLFYHQDVSEA